MKIQINSLAALERLIGDDKEMEFAVKDSIINTFAKNYLKSIAHSEIIDALKKAVLYELEKDLNLVVERTSSWAGCTYKAKPELKEAVDKAAKEALNEIVKEAVNEKMAGINEEVNQRVGYALDCICAKVAEVNIDRLVRERLTKMLNQTTEGK